MADSGFDKRHEGCVVYETTTRRIVDGKVEAIEEGPSIILPKFMASAMNWADCGDSVPFLKTGETFLLTDQYADGAEKFDRAREHLVAAMGVAANIFGWDLPTVEPLARAETALVAQPEKNLYRGAFGSEIGKDGLARFPAPPKTSTMQFVLTLYRNAVQMRVGEVLRTYSYREAGLYDRKKTAPDANKENRFYDLLDMILAGGGMISWGEKSRQGLGAPELRWRKRMDSDLFEQTDEMAGLNGPRENLKTDKKDFQNRLRKMTGMEGLFFHNYSKKKCPGYKPVFQLVDRRKEDLPFSDGGSALPSPPAASSASEEVRLQEERERLIRESESDWKTFRGKSGHEGDECGEDQEELYGDGVSFSSDDIEGVDDE